MALFGALMAWIINQALIRLGFRGKQILAIFGPVVEETLKTGLALIFKTPIIAVHVIFGLVEGLWEIVNKPHSIGPVMAAWGGHTFFGLLAYVSYNITEQSGIAWMSGLLAHLVWNRLILTLHHKP